MVKKSELLEEAKKLKLKVTPNNTIAEIQASIKEAEKQDKDTSKKPTKNGEDKPKLTKAGKHSEKGVLETKKKQEKIEKQLHKDDNLDDQEKPSKPKVTIKPTRPKLYFSGFSFFNGSHNIFCNRATFRIWHKAFRP